MLIPSDSVAWTSPLEKWVRNPKSLRMAINAHCWQCVGGSNSSEGRILTMREIRDCRSEVCPLNTVRPYQNAEETDESA